MILKGIIDEDFTNFQQLSMLLVFPKCSFKCGKRVCHNSELAKSPDINIDTTALVQRYLNNPITSAVVCAGLEPFDTFKDLFEFIRELRIHTNDYAVIYTGYVEKEIEKQIKPLYNFKNIIIKFGRYIPNHEKHFDEVLGVWLASDNQYAKQLS